ncbi:Telomerase reverse transcriptase, partial [Bonamia ostreae]
MLNFNKNQSTELKISHKFVIRLIYRIIKQNFPKNFLGSKKNFRQLTKSVSSFIKMDLHGKIRISEISNKIKLSSIKWLPNLSSSKTDFEIRTKLLNIFLYWFFSQFLVSILTKLFYITNEDKS